MSTPIAVQTELTGFEEALVDCEEAVNDLLAVHRLAKETSLTPVEQAKLKTSLAYSVNALYYAYVRSQGGDPSSHPVKSDLDRVKAMNQRVVQAASGKAAPQRRATVNTSSAKRLVKSVIGEKGKGGQRRAKSASRGGRRK